MRNKNKCKGRSNIKNNEALKKVHEHCHNQGPAEPLREILAEGTKTDTGPF